MLSPSALSFSSGYCCGYYCYSQIPVDRKKQERHKLKSEQWEVVASVFCWQPGTLDKACAQVWLLKNAHTVEETMAATSCQLISKSAAITRAGDYHFLTWGHALCVCWSSLLISSSSSTTCLSVCGRWTKVIVISVLTCGQIYLSALLLRTELIRSKVSLFS